MAASAGLDKRQTAAMMANAILVFMLFSLLVV